ncbi:hypothetical protein BaRGS_00030493 [Batillaria attramentaria]|uniref:Uncharacterized protein n=1 Tax=Batillaria attramentaria TaxID=370345 RepID=A0ABD0JT05_9CAEN
MLTCKIAIQEASKVFSKSSTTVEEVISAEENGIVCLYNGNSDDSLDGLRYKNVRRKEALLQIVRCKCKTSCDSRRCSCRKHGLTCSAACGGYNSITCSNPMVSREEVTEQ